MRKLHSILTNPFNDPDISIDGLMTFTTYFLEAAKAEPLAVLDPLIAPTQAAHDGVAVAFGFDLSSLSDRKMAIGRKKAFRAALPAAISPIAVKIESQFGERSAEYKGCFAQGRKIFRRCPDAELGPELDALVAFATKYQAQLGADTLNAAIALQSGWDAVFSPARSAKGSKGASKEAKNTARTVLQLQLFKNLLTLALEFPDQPEKLDIYMRQSLLEPHTQYKSPAVDNEN